MHSALMDGAEEGGLVEAAEPLPQPRERPKVGELAEPGSWRHSFGGSGVASKSGDRRRGTDGLEFGLKPSKKAKAAAAANPNRPEMVCDTVAATPCCWCW